MADSTVKVNFIGDSSSLKRATDAADGHLRSLAGGIANLAKQAAIGFAAVGVGAAVFAKSAVSAASDLAESQGKVNVVFKEQAAEITAWAATASKAFGQSKQSALEAVGTFGNLFQAFGLGRQDSAKMSKSLVELAADLASFNNTSVEDALLALRSGLSGETEPLKKYGIALSDVRLKTEAVRLGLIKTTKEALTPAAKAQASYSLIMKDSALAQGDFARTSDGLANKTRILKARFADIQAEIGTKLLPIVTSLAGVLLDRVLPVFEKVGGAAGKFFANLFGEGVGEGSTDKMLSWSATLRRVFEEEILPAVKNVFGWMRDNIPPVLEAIGRGLKTAFAFLMDNKEILIGIVAAIGAGFAIWAISAAAAALATLAAIAPFIAAAAAIGVLVGGLLYAYNHWNAFHDAVDKAWQLLQKFADWVEAELVPKIRIIIQILAEVTVAFWHFVIDVRDVARDIADIFATVGQAIWEPFRWAFEKIDAAWGPISAILDKVAMFGGVFLGSGNALRNGINNPPSAPALSPLNAAIQQRDALGGAAGGATVIVNALDPQSAARAVVDALKAYESMNGPIPVATG